jgi:hypothetical protein
MVMVECICPLEKIGFDISKKQKVDLVLWDYSGNRNEALWPYKKIFLPRIRIPVRDLI